MATTEHPLETTAAASGGLTRRQWHLVAFFLVAIVAVALPFLASGYQTHTVTKALIYAVALMGLNVLTGYSGQISLGHGAFFAIGAYTAAILIYQWEVPYYWTVPAAGVVCLVVGFLFGYPAGRLEHLYLALATFALAIAVPQILKYDPLEHWTGGVQGIYIFRPEAPEGIPLDPDQWLYFFSLAVVVIMFLAAWNMLRGRPGRALIAIRDHTIAAKTMGVDTALYKSLAFGVSAFYTGVSGALMAIVTEFVSPDSFNFFVSISFLVGMVVGGLASISGAIYGGIFIQFVPNVAEEISKAAPWAVYGVIMIGFMFLMPYGIAGGVRWLIAKLERRKNRPPAEPGGQNPDGG